MIDKRLIYIRNTVCNVLGSEIGLFDLHSRCDIITEPRHYYHYLCKELTYIKLKEIIKLSGVTHPSVYHSWHTVKKWLDSDKLVRKNVKIMKERLKMKLFQLKN